MLPWDTFKIGFIVHTPISNLCGHPNQPSSLNEVIKVSSRVSPLEQRFAMATKLVKIAQATYTQRFARCANSFHRVVFANTSHNDRTPLLSEPFFLGLTYIDSEEDDRILLGQHEGTKDDEALCHHLMILSKAPRERLEYTRAYDVYSLGCILLEIGLRQRLEDFWEPMYADNSGLWLKHLAETRAGELSGKSGSVYETVVKNCLLVDVDVVTDDNNALAEFCEGMLGKVEASKDQVRAYDSATCSS